DECRRHRNEPHARWHHGADPDREVDVGRARHVGPRKHGLSDAGALLGIELHGRVRLALLVQLASLILLALLRSLLILLALLRSLLILLALLRRLLVLLTLLARRLAGRLVTLPLASGLARLLALVALLGLSLLALLALTLTGGLVLLVFLV